MDERRVSIVLDITNLASSQVGQVVRDIEQQMGRLARLSQSTTKGGKTSLTAQIVGDTKGLSNDRRALEQHLQGIANAHGATAARVSRITDAQTNNVQKAARQQAQAQMQGARQAAADARAQAAQHSSTAAQARAAAAATRAQTQAQIGQHNTQAAAARAAQAQLRLLNTQNKTGGSQSLGQQALGLASSAVGEILNVAKWVVLYQGIRAVVDQIAQIPVAMVQANTALQDMQATFLGMSGGSRTVAASRTAAVAAFARSVGRSPSQVADEAVGFSPFARNATDLQHMLKTAELLSMKNPEQGLGGAAIAINEAMAGQFRSLVTRFNIPKATLDSAGGATTLDKVDNALAKMNITWAVVTERLQTFNGQLGVLSGHVTDFLQEVGQSAVNEMTSGLVDLNRMLGVNQGSIKDTADAIGKTLGDAMKGLIDWIKTNGPQTFADFQSGMEGVIGAIQALTTGIGLLAWAIDNSWIGTMVRAGRGAYRTAAEQLAPPAPIPISTFSTYNSPNGLYNYPGSGGQPVPGGAPSPGFYANPNTPIVYDHGGGSDYVPYNPLGSTVKVTGLPTQILKAGSTDEYTFGYAPPTDVATLTLQRQAERASYGSNAVMGRSLNSAEYTSTQAHPETAAMESLVLKAAAANAEFNKLNIKIDDMHKKKGAFSGLLGDLQDGIDLLTKAGIKVPAAVLQARDQAKVADRRNTLEIMKTATAAVQQAMSVGGDPADALAKVLTSQQTQQMIVQAQVVQINTAGSLGGPNGGLHLMAGGSSTAAAIIAASQGRQRASGMRSNAVGSPFIPQDGAYWLHSGEMVMTRGQVRQASGGNTVVYQDNRKVDLSVSGSKDPVADGQRLYQGVNKYDASRRPAGAMGHM